ncbi:MAG: glutamine synthetase, partial [Myxococcales bacterium]|nr:glutamine synthetase [Myxococcales bacterium]
MGPIRHHSGVERESISQTFADRGVDKVKIGGFDLDGVLRGKYVSLDKFWSALDKGFGFCDVVFGWDINDTLYDNGTVTGWHSGYPDVLARIDPSTMRFLPSEPKAAHFLCDFYDEQGKPHTACPRNLLRRIVAQAESRGFFPKFGSEFEFWVFEETAHGAAEKNYRGMKPISPGMFGYSWVRTGQHQAFVHDIMDTCREYGIPLEGLHTETGPGVYEAAIAFDDAVAAADKAALFKTTVKQIATRHGLMATFMAKWNADLPGSSGHLHQSLWDSTGETNLFSDPNADRGLSQHLRHYVGGQKKLMPALTALYSPTINTYKRYVPGVWAPLTASWGIENRTCAIRVIPG